MVILWQCPDVSTQYLVGPKETMKWKSSYVYPVPPSLCLRSVVDAKIDYSTHCTVYPKKYAHGFVVLCFVVVTQSFIMNSHEVFNHIRQGCFTGTGAIVRLPQCQWSKPDGYGKISQCLTTTKHSKAKIVCIFLVIYCSCDTGKRKVMPNSSNIGLIHRDMYDRSCKNI